MGIPVSGKNLFPSNIAGLPTWYTIRASKDGYVARKKEIDILIAMNAETAKDDMLSLPAGGVADLRRDANLKQYRDDVTCYPVPFDKITAAVCPGGQAAQAGQEHGVCRRGGAASRHGSGDRRSRSAPAVCEEAEGSRPELGGGAGGLRLRARLR